MAFEGNRKDYETKRSRSTYGKRHETPEMERLRKTGKRHRDRSGGVNYTNTRSGANTATSGGGRSQLEQSSGWGPDNRSSAYQGDRHRDAYNPPPSTYQGDRHRDAYNPPSTSTPDIRRGDSPGGGENREQERWLREMMEKDRQKRAEEEAKRAEEERLRVLGETKASAISGAEEFGGGDAAKKYREAYQQRLADAYDASKTGVGRGILEAGYATGDEYTALEDAKLGQEEWLHELGAEYQGKAQSTYDDWLKTNTDAINALGTKEEVDAYDWTDANYDLDLTGGKAFGSEGAYDENYIPEFYEGFSKEFSEDYSDPTMPDEWGGYKNPDLTGVKSATLTPNPSNPQEGPRRTVKKQPQSMTSGVNPFSSGSAKYY